MELDFARWRRTLGLTQDEAGQVLGVGERRVRDYERGVEPPIGTQYLMTRLLWDAAAGVPLGTVPYYYLEVNEVGATEAAIVAAWKRKDLLAEEMPLHRQHLPAEKTAGADRQELPAAEIPGADRQDFPAVVTDASPPAASGSGWIRRLWS
jgi:transcriptional regulator with XRE-family HTH domain